MSIALASRTATGNRWATHARRSRSNWPMKSERRWCARRDGVRRRRRWRCGRGSCWPARTAGRTPRSPTISAVTGATVGKWRYRFAAEGLEGWPAHRSGRQSARRSWPGRSAFSRAGSWPPVHDAVEIQVGDRLARGGQAFTDHLHTGRRAAHHAAAGLPAGPAVPRPAVGLVQRSWPLIYHTAAPCRSARAALGLPLLVPVRGRMEAVAYLLWRVCQALDHAAGVRSAAPSPGPSSYDSIDAAGTRWDSNDVPSWSLRPRARTAVPGCRAGAWGSRGMRESRGGCRPGA